MSAPGALVLVIEDNPVNRELLLCLLAALGYRCVTAADGVQGLQQAHLHRPELILCDIQMPVMDGIEFARLAKADPQLRGIPLVALTALAMVGDRERILAAGFDGYLSKPIDPARFAGLVEPLLAGPPPAPPAPASVSEGDAVQPTLTPRQGTILVVDDTDFNLVLKRDLLEPHGYDVVTSSDPAEALQLARLHRPQLVVSDVGLRTGSGLDLLQALRADPVTRDIPLVFASATHWDVGTEQRALALGAAAYLRRPIDPGRMLEVIEASLRRR